MTSTVPVPTGPDAADAAISLRLLTPEAALRAGEHVAGGKAMGLARLTRVSLDTAGAQVPPWVVLPADALASKLAALGTLPAVEQHLVHLAQWRGAAAGGLQASSRTAEAIASLASAVSLTASERSDLAEAARALGPGPWALRSSAVGEDGARHSFAGQFDSVLGACDADALAEGVARVWRSAFGVRALEYRRRAGTLAQAPRIAVIVQQLVAGEISGVMFTADPLTGDARRMRVSSCWGLGDGLVAGRTDADEYLLERNGCVVETHVRCKTVRVVVTATGTREETVPPELQETPTLHDAALARLAAAGDCIAAHEGGARDIEWTFARARLFVLQVRPCTAVTAPLHLRAGDAAPARRRTVWDNSNIQESYSGVTTPLTFSFASAAYAAVYEQTMRAVGVPERVIVAHRPLLCNLLGLLRGRVYYNLGNWYRGLLFLPAFRRNKADMEAMMGVEEPVDFIVAEPGGIIAVVRRIPALARALAMLLWRFITLRRAIPRFLADIDTTLRGIDRSGLARQDLGALMQLLERLQARCIERWTTPIVNDFYTMMCVGRLRRIVAHAVPGRRESLIQILLGGASAADSAGPAMLLLRMAAIARENVPVAAALTTPDPGTALARGCAASPAFAALLDELHDRYGDRCMGELKLESIPMRENPAFVLRMLRNYLDATTPGAAGIADHARAARERAQREVECSLAPLARLRFQWALHAARHAIQAREAMRLMRTRLFGVHRDIYRAVGTRLHERGRLNAPGDVFYLTAGEITDYWEGRAASVDLAAAARARRAEYAGYHHVALPNRVITEGDPYDSLDAVCTPTSGQCGPRLPDPHVLRGLGCSAGVAEGPVRVVTSPASDLALAGHVLVAPRTDPGWAPLFPSAVAVIVERGSLLSHSAVLARELGVPAVVGIPGVVATLRDGERVRVNGVAGTVERLDHPRDDEAEGDRS